MPQLETNQKQAGGLNNQERWGSVGLIFFFLIVGVAIVFLLVPKAPRWVQMPTSLLTFLLLGILARLTAVKVWSNKVTSSTTTFLKTILYADIVFYYLILDFWAEKKTDSEVIAGIKHEVFVGLTPEHAIIVGISLLELISNATDLFGKKKKQRKRIFKPVITARRQ